MNKPIRFKLFLMMVLEFFIWGCWLPLIYGYLPSLQFTPAEQSWILNAFPIAAIIGMFFSNQYADRHFAAEKFLGFSHLVGGVAILLLAFTRSFWPFFGLMFVHCLLYVPTLSIANSIAFANMKDPQKEFGLVRVGGSIGWILAAWPFTFILVDWDKVHAANPQGLVHWLGVVLSSGLTRSRAAAGHALDLHRGRDRLACPGGLQPDAAAHAAQEGGERGRPLRLAGGGQAAQAPVRARALDRDVRGLVRALQLFQLDGRVPGHQCLRRAVSAFPATGSCRS